MKNKRKPKKRTKKTTPPFKGMKVIPEGYGTPAWNACLGAAWIACLRWAAQNPAWVGQFLKETGRKEVTQECAPEWCDWVTVNVWGVHGSRSR